MQKLDQEGRYIAQWGAYVLVLTIRGGGRCHIDVIGVDGAVVASTPDLPPRTSPEAIGWAARQLEERGAVAFVDGRKQLLAAFLQFVPEMETGK